jgi:hypothetical protein
VAATTGSPKPLARSVTVKGAPCDGEPAAAHTPASDEAVRKVAPAREKRPSPKDGEVDTRVKVGVEPPVGSKTWREKIEVPGSARSATTHVAFGGGESQDCEYARVKRRRRKNHHIGHRAYAEKLRIAHR